MPENRMASIIEILKHQLFFLFCSFPSFSTIFSMKLFVPALDLSRATELESEGKKKGRRRFHIRVGRLHKTCLSKSSCSIHCTALFKEEHHP